MQTAAKTSNWNGITTTQIGAIGESLVATSLVFASDGRLAPFIPFADDDGIDLLIYDKVSKSTIPLQVKSRTKFDNQRSETVQFDVRSNTFSEESGTQLLAILLDGMEITCSWLIPMSELRQNSMHRKNKLSIVPSAKITSKDRYTYFRHHSIDSVVETLIRSF